MITNPSWNIAVIGTGNIGGTLGRAFAREGHRVSFGSRNPDTDPVAGDSTAKVTDVASALDAADVIVLAVPGPAIAALVARHAEVLAGKLVIDCANNLGAGPAHSHDAITTAASSARYARAFNTLGFENLADPRFGGTVADMFFSTAETDRPALETLIAALGLRPVYVGPDAHDIVDGVLRLWFALAIGQQRGRRLAFRVLDARDL